MKSPNLYHIQDSERPMWVAAINYLDAINRWKRVVAMENEMPIREVEEPQGVQLVCTQDEYLA